MADREAELRAYLGEPEPAPAAPPIDREAELDRYLTDTNEVTREADDMRAEMLRRGGAIGEGTALRYAAEVAPEFYALPGFLQGWVSTSPGVRAKLERIRTANRAINVVERAGGGWAYWTSRVTAVRGAEWLYKKFSPSAAQSYERLARYMPELGQEHAGETPSLALHDQLDDAVADSARGNSWLDSEPQYMEHMSHEVKAEQLYVAMAHGGDWQTYQADLDAMPLAQRITTRAPFTAIDIFGDPMWYIGSITKALKVIPGVARLVDQAMTARKLGEPLRDVRGAAETVRAVHGPIGDLTQHVARLESKLETLGEVAGSEQHARVARRLMEARAELAARQEEAATPALKFYGSPRRRPQTVFAPRSAMSPEEYAARQGIAEQHASIQDVEVAAREVGAGGTSDLMDRMDSAYEALRRGDATEADLTALGQFERLPGATKEHLNQLGYSRRRVMEAAALERGAAEDLARHADVTNPTVASTRAAMGPDDVEEAGAALAHMRDGGNPAHLALHAVNAPEYSVVGQGAVPPTDGIFLMERPTYRAVNVNGVRSMSRHDAFTYLLGRQSIPGLAEGSVHLDAPALVKAVNKVGKQIAFGTARFLPLSASTFVPDVAKTFDQAHLNYKLFVNESQDYLAGSLVRSGLFERTKAGTVKMTQGLQDYAERVIKALDTPVDRLTGTSPELERQLAKMPEHHARLYRDVRAWLDAQAERLGLDPGTAISGYFPHYFPEGDRRITQRALEFLGVNRKAFVSFWALKHRMGAEGWSTDLVSVLDLYNRGAMRKVVMEPAYQRITEMADAYRKAGKFEEARYADKFLADARGMSRSIFDWSAEQLGTPEKFNNAVEAVARRSVELFYKALLGGNLNYAVQNMAGGLTNAAAQHGPFRLMQGLLRFATPEGRRIAEESGVMREALHSLEGMPGYGPRTKGLAGVGVARKALDAAYGAMDVGQRTEHVLRGVAVNTALSEMVNRSGKTWREVRELGLDKAFIKEAARATDRSQHVFGPLGRSPYLHSLLGHTGYQATIQLGTYPWKQAEFLLKNMAGDPGFIVRYLAYSGMAAHMAAEELGVALAPSVGLGFAEAVVHPRKGRAVPLSPGSELLASTVDLWQSWASGDPRQAELAKDNWWQAVQAGVFGLNQLERYSRNMRESFAGRKEKFQEREALPEVLRQLREAEPEVAHATRELETSERLAHALGIRTVQDEIERSGKEIKRGKRFERLRRRMEARKNRKAILREQEDALDAYTEALRAGDGAAAHRIYQEGQAKGWMNFAAEPGQAAREAAFLRKRLQTLRRSPGFLPLEMGERP